jgi:two-component system, chemotaxis family, protein-glutamate methylesterase/glutaminase
VTRPPIRVLVVDDSAFARKVVREVLSSAPGIEVVGFARDGLDALEKIADLAPDVVTVDLQMPNLDGVGLLQALQGRPGPRCVVVSTSDAQSDVAIRALQAGAVELVHKPTALATDRLYELSTELVDKVRIAAAAQQPVVAQTPAPPVLLPDGDSAVRIVVIGASTGGPQAVTRLLTELPADFPVPIAVVLHMPVGYTSALSERLNQACAIRVVEAYEGAPLQAAVAVVGQAGMHLKIVREGAAPRVHLDVVPLDTRHRPAVDVLFTTAAEAYGAGVLAVVLTGMGDDGLLGAHAVHAAGGMLFTQTEASCVVYGMPRTVDEAGLGSERISIEGMASAIQRAVGRSSRVDR